MNNDDIGTLEDLVKLSLEKSFNCIEDAKKLIGEKSFDGAVNRAYYGIFWAISTIHLLDGNKFRKHKDAIGMFNKNYVHTEIFPKDFGRKIANAENARHKSDYDILTKATEETATEHIEFAVQLFEAVKSYCESKNFEKVSEVEK